VTPETAVQSLRQQVATAQRVASLRQRRASHGLVRLELYVHPDDRAAIKALAQQLHRTRTESK
jgi:hypothetical protein